LASQNKKHSSLLLYESINSILNCYQDSFALAINDSVTQESSAVLPLEYLRQNGILLYKIQPQGRVLRVLLAGNIPVLLIEPYMQKLSVNQTDVIYAFQKPNFAQSNRLGGDTKYEFKTAGGFNFTCPDLEALNPNGWREAKAKTGMLISGCNAPCISYILTTKSFNLKKIKRIINDGLSDVGFEYKLPEFEELKTENSQ
jgi:hypothetical protein